MKRINHHCTNLDGSCTFTARESIERGIR
ncbi:hypothetical protein [Rosenbergiella nectarea]|nr:hypothetical protein [Rosenbergiella nectarea]